ncbi:DUF1501 domain-containing protein [Panacibacter ginsenosidivorans]|uniref:DUF1501 domain-containing protein n=1 Tax=Panacibacter ginsenosidivorans TaxID=1813871 RepID=A0A5B8VDU3_9BACT|nr:DUF1501 domain-containing protein [Panacibacter ginsenosidivorans]QEC68458.1 DUF1501 domain-containing protein [Panacibacter ginsenosidivorans]
MYIKRRQFLQTGSLATASFMLPKFLKAFEKNNGFVPQGNKVVVVLQLSGGNDGLNTVIPVRNDIYYSSRPKLGIAKGEALLLNDETGIHPALAGFKSLFDDGSLGILNNVGYPNPDRSHFRSMDIWQSASKSDEYVNTGWIGRYLDAQCSGCAHPTQALEIDDVLSLALKGAEQKAIAVKDPGRLYNASREKDYKKLVDAHDFHDHDAPVNYLYKIMAETLSSADYIFEQSKLRPTKASYPKTELGSNLKTIASLILSDINTKIYYVSLGSFDTHVNQQNTQQRLFREMNDAVTSFVQDMKDNHRFDDVLLFTFSEFGRRVAQNASGGTDHGTANNMFLVSGALNQKGIINELPDLTNLQDGDLQHKIDFKNVYATILNKWLATDDKLILKQQYDYLNFI